MKVIINIKVKTNSIEKMVNEFGIRPEAVVSLKALSEELGLTDEEFAQWASHVLYKRMIGDDVFDISSIFSDEENNRGFGIWDERDF